MTALRLPSFDAITDMIAEHLLEGRIVVLRGQPWSGRTTVIASVAERLAGLIDVVSVSGSDSSGTLAAASDELEALLSSGRSTAMLVDDFGLALGTEHGVVFQNRLHALAVDSEHAPEAGVLLAARHNDSLTRFAAPGGGSPIAGAAQVNVNMPILSREEILGGLAEAGCDAGMAERLVAMYGGHLHLLRVAQEAGESAVPEAVQDEAVMRVVAETTGATAERMLELARRPERSLAEATPDALLAPAVYIPEPGMTRLCPTLPLRGIARLMVGERAGWPDNVGMSARRFQCRLQGLEGALWVDRYFGRHLDALSDFLDELARRGCRLTLHMLGSASGIEGLPNPPIARFTASRDEWRQVGFHVEWRIAADRDYDLVHQRMLVSRRRVSGYLLPPCDRVTCVHAGGTDTDAILERAPLALLARAWDDAAAFPPP